MSNIWFTSDNHFDHKNAIKFCPTTRKGADHLEMSELMIAKWNEQVAYNDTVYCLGDLSFADHGRTTEIIKRLNGNKYLIIGNHDKWINQENSKLFMHISSYMEHKIDKIDVIMFHYPVAEWNKMHYGAFHLHGHVHGKDMKIPGKIMDVGIDTRTSGDMGLYSWDEVIAFMKDRRIMGHH